MNEICKKKNDTVHQLCVSGIYRRSFKILLQIAIRHTLPPPSLSLSGEFLFKHEFPVEKPFPAFLHDYFITEVRLNARHEGNPDMIASIHFFSHFNRMSFLLYI